jgi:hypothetical protein
VKVTAVAYVTVMGKRVTDLTAEELDRLAGDAWFESSSAALRAGAAVVGREGSKIVKTYPDGRKEVLKDARPLVKVEAAHSDKTGSTRPRRTSSRSKRARRTG